MVGGQAGVGVVDVVNLFKRSQIRKELEGIFRRIHSFISIIDIININIIISTIINTIINVIVAVYSIGGIGCSGVNTVFVYVNGTTQDVVFVQRDVL